MIRLMRHLYQTDSIKSLLPHVRGNTCVLLDLDKTLINTTHVAGGDDWFTKLMDLNVHRADAAKMVTSVYTAVQQYSVSHPVETDTVRTVLELQEVSTVVLGITARSEAVAQTTLRQLESCGIDFCIGRERMNTPVLHEGSQCARLHDNIIFCDGNDKGLCFQAYAQQVGLLPGTILAADDREKHLLAIQRAADNLGVDNFIGARYGRLDHTIHQVDMALAARELSYLHQYLPLDVQEHIVRLNIPIQPIPPQEEADFKFYLPTEIKR